MGLKILHVCNQLFGTYVNCSALCLQIGLIFSYQHNMDPYLRIGPFKIEELNEEPIVLMFHDFLPNVETDEIVSRASSKLFMSQTGFAGAATQNMQLRLVII